MAKVSKIRDFQKILEGGDTYENAVKITGLAESTAKGQLARFKRLKKNSEKNSEEKSDITYVKE